MALRILLADDSMTAQNMGKKILTDAGFDVVTVSNGAAAVKKIAEASPDLAILDVYMPGYTGLEVCERLKTTPATGRVPVLLSVGKMEPFRPEEGMKVKADGVIIKPFEATDLVAVVDKLVERTYGADAKTTGIVADVVAETPEEPVAVAAPALPEESSQSEARAEGLQTFAPAVAGADMIAPEPNIEFTSAPKTGAVLEEPLPDLEPTAQASVAVEQVAEDIPMPAVQPLQSAEQDALDAFVQATLANAELDDLEVVEDSSAEGDNSISSEQDAPEELAAAVAAGASQETVSEGDVPTGWTAIETDVSEQDLGIDGIDLEAEMQAAAQEQPSLEPRPAETGAPFLAPLGKTSFDELDAIIEQNNAEQSAAEQSAAGADEQAVDLQPAAAIAEQVCESAVQEEAVPDEVALDIPVCEEPDCEAAAAVSEEEAAAEPFAIADDLNVAVLDEPVLGASEEAEAAAASEQSEADCTEPLSALPDELQADAVLETDADATALSALKFYGLPDELDSPLRNPIEEEDEPLFALTGVLTALQPKIVANGEPTEVQEPDALLDSDLIEPAMEPAQGMPMEASMMVETLRPEPTLATGELVAEIPTVLEETTLPEESPAVEAEASQAAPAEDAPAAPAMHEEVIGGMVERVVDRVVDRLKPILVVMVEEILVELKSRTK